MDSLIILPKFHHIAEAYISICRPICEEYQIGFPAFNILMTLANQPELVTANEISKSQSIKPSLMSFHVDKLVHAGYLERQHVDGNRRCIKLVYTEKAVPVISRGREAYSSFLAQLTAGLCTQDM